MTKDEIMADMSARMELALAISEVRARVWAEWWRGHEERPWGHAWVEKMTRPLL